MRNIQYSFAEDALQLAKGDDGLLIKSSVAAAHAKKVVPDQDLTWKQVGSSYMILVDKMRETFEPPNPSRKKRVPALPEVISIWSFQDDR